MSETQASETLPRIIIHMDGGLVHSITASVPVECLVEDMDIEGADNDELTTIYHDDGSSSEALLGGRQLDIDPALVARRFKEVEEAEEEE